MSGLDLDCEDTSDDDAVAPARPAEPRRKLRGRRVISGAEGDEHELVVTCPLRGVASFEACASCPRFRSFSVSPSGRDSFVRCTGDDRPALPIPLDATTRGRALRTPITEVMSDPVCARPDVPIVRLAKVLTETGLSGLPVVDTAGRAIGFVTKTDALSVIWASAAPSSVGDIMSRKVDALRVTGTLLEAIDLMAAETRRRLPVVDDEGAVVGMISLTDVNRWLALSEPGRWSFATPAAL